MRLGECIGRASLAFALVSAACSDPDEPAPATRTCLDYDEVVSDVPDFPLAYTTEHLDVHIDGDRFLCAGSVVDYERHVQYVAAELGIECRWRLLLPDFECMCHS
jgi:hypothetical protein